MSNVLPAIWKLGRSDNYHLNVDFLPSLEHVFGVSESVRKREGQQKYGDVHHRLYVLYSTNFPNTSLE